MKIKRLKKLNKSINFYINHFGFRQPYQLLLDGTFCYAALENKINIADNIPRYLQGEVKLLTTQCCLIEIENLGRKLSGALLILKKSILHKCGHEGKPIPASKCLLSMIGKQNDKHYLIATQDRELQDKTRQIPGVPLIYLHIKTPILEQPSSISMDYLKNISCLTSIEKETISNLKLSKGIVENSEVKHKKRKKKGPNPLSCLKKKNKPQQNHQLIKKVQSNTEIDKKKRKKIRIPKHVKEELIKNLLI